MRISSIKRQYGIALACHVIFSNSCATTPVPPSESEFSIIVKTKGQDAARETYKIQLRGNPWLGGYKIEKDGKDYSARSYLDKFDQSSLEMHNWKLYSAYLIGAVGGALLLVNSGAMIMYRDYMFVGVPLHLVGLGASITSFLLLFGWYESDIPKAAETYNDAIESWINYPPQPT